MKLITLAYRQGEDTPRPWLLEKASFDSINLIVGRNSGGKSRTLNVINSLALLLTGALKPFSTSAIYEVEFQSPNNLIFYKLEIVTGKVVSEELKRDDEWLLKRAHGGEGEIYDEQTLQLERFQTPDTDLTAATRRDSLRHSFFEEIHTWAMGVIHFSFNSNLGKQHLLVIMEGAPPHKLQHTHAVVQKFRIAVAEFKEKFTSAIEADMQACKYNIKHLEVGACSSVAVQIDSIPQTALALKVHEEGLEGLTEQMEISDGMFRVLSLLIQIHSALLRNEATCIIIDDIGEGLDYERSCAIIRVLQERLRGSNLQLIMSTNDRFVMNAVPLEYWSVIDREKSVVRLLNYKNCRDKFDEFKFTGLNNFDFFASDFIKN